MSKPRRPRKHYTVFSAVYRFLCFLAVVLLTYLLHVTLMPSLRIGGVTPGLIFAVLGVMTVCFERLRTIWAGMIFGILLEIMQPTVPLLNLILYPVIAILGVLIFSDKSMQRLEYERGLGKPGRNMAFWLRTPLCAAVDTLVYEIVNIGYVYLREDVFDIIFIRNAVLDILATALLSLLIMFPLRRLFGVRVAPDPSTQLQPKPYQTSKQNR